MSLSFLGSPALHETWPEFQKYLASHFQWSDPIKSIAARAHQELSLHSAISNPDGEPYLALHFRRGTFEP